MAISFVGAGNPGNNGLIATVPGATVGDLLIVIGYNSGPSSPNPTIPAGWTSIGSGFGPDDVAQRGAYRFMQAGDTHVGLWVNVEDQILLVYRGVDPQSPIGALANSGSISSNTVTYPALTLQVTDGSSWVVATGIHESATNLHSVNPSGLTAREDADFGHAAAKDTNGGVSSWSAVGGVVNSSNNWNAYSIELRAAAKPRFISAGGVIESGSTTLVDVPPGAGSAAGDLEIMQVYVRDATNTPTTPSGWTLLTGPLTIGTGGTPARMWVYGQILAAAGANVTVSIPGGNAKAARRYLFRDPNGAYTGTVTSFFEGGYPSITDQSDVADVPNVTTTTADSLMIALVTGSDDITSIAPPTGWAEPVAEYLVTTLADGILGIATRPKIVAGAETIGSFALTGSSGDKYATVVLVLTPAPPLAQVSRDLATTWGVLASVARSLATSWNVDESLVAVGRSLATSWQGHVEVGRSLVTTWTTHEAEGFSVPQWRVFVDWDGSGWDEITDDVRALRWQRGSSGGDGLGSASPGTASVDLYDPSNRYLDTNEGSDLFGVLRTGGMAWIAMQHEGLTYPLFGGRVKAVVPTASYLPIEQVAQLLLEDEIGQWARLGRVVTIPAELEGIGAHELREAILDEVGVPAGWRELAPNNDPLVVGREVTFTDDDGEQVTFEEGLDGTPAELLAAVNAATMGRHFIRPGSSTSHPWDYVAVDRNHKIDDPPDAELELLTDYSELTGWRVGDDTRIGYVAVRPRQWVSGVTVEVDSGDPADPSAMQLTSDLLPAASAAQGIADAYAWRFRAERQRPTLILDGAPRVPLMVQHELYDVLAITDPRYHLAGRRMEIVGLSGEWAGTRPTMRWTLQDAPQQEPLQRFLRLDRGDELDDDDLDIGR